MSWYIQVLKKYAVFKGRARRKEYWNFVLFHVLIIFVLAMIESYTVPGKSGHEFGPLVKAYILAVFLPGLAVSVRRLHDMGNSGWWYFINLVPIVGPIGFLVFMLTEGNVGENDFGDNPKEAVR